MCELHVRLKLYRAPCGLSDADSNCFRIRGIRNRAVCLQSVTLYKNVQVRMLGDQRKNGVSNLREIGLNLISNSVYALA